MNASNTFIKQNQQLHYRASRLVSSLIISLALAFMFFAGNATAGTLAAGLERSTITFGETATLIINLPPSINAQPDLSPLKKDFDIVDTGSSSQIQIFNGKRTEQRQLTITLMPRHHGKVTVPAIKIGNAQTRPLQLTVDDIPVASHLKNSNAVWLEIDTPMKKQNVEVMVQQEVPVTVKLFSALPLNNVSISEPAPENAITEKLGDDIQYNTQINGQSYQVLEQHYVIFPEKAGDLTIPPVVLRASTPDHRRQQRSFGGSLFDDPFFQNSFAGHSQIQKMLQDSGMLFGTRGKSVTVRSDGLKLYVEHIPDVAQGKPWLPARKVSLTSSWQGKPPALVSGEPSSLTVTVKAEGVIGTQIPALSIVDKNGSYRVYSEPAKVESLTDGERVTGTRTQTFTLIPEKAGKLELAAIKQPWWNTKTQQMQLAEIPAMNLTIAQGTNNTNQNSTPATGNTQAASTVPVTNSSDAQTSTKAVNVNQLLASIVSNSSIVRDHRLTGGLIALVILLLIAVFYFWRKKHTTVSLSAEIESTKEVNEQQQIINKQRMKTALQESITACKTGDTKLAAGALLQWAKLAWPDIAPVSLLDIAGNVIDGGDNIRQLHHYLYQPPAQNKNWTDAELAELLRHGLQRKISHNKPSNKKTLPPLYPA